MARRRGGVPEGAQAHHVAFVEQFYGVYGPVQCRSVQRLRSISRHVFARELTLWQEKGRFARFAEGGGSFREELPPPAAAAAAAADL